MPIDVRALLPLLLPLAITWAEATSRDGAGHGRELNAMEIAIARAVGVKQPERIRIVTLEELPFPGDAMLKKAARDSGLLTEGAVGLTLDHVIFLLDGYESPRILTHEFRHVQQYEESGSISGFLPKYIEQVLEFGYERAPFERDARANERKRFDVPGYTVE